MTIVHTEKHALSNGKVLRMTIKYDDCCNTPREWDNLGTLLLHPNKSHWTCKKSFEAAGYESDLIVDLDVEKGNDPYEHLDNLIREQLGLNPRDVIAYPITEYEHGNIALSLGYKQGWDYGVVGFVFVTKEKIRKEYGVKRVTKSILERVEACLESELDTLESWINGDVYGYTIEQVTYDELGDEVECEHLDSCWGFIGDEDYCKSEAESMVKHYLTNGIN